MFPQEGIQTIHMVHVSHIVFESSRGETLAVFNPSN